MAHGVGVLLMRSLRLCLQNFATSLVLLCSRSWSSVHEACVLVYVSDSERELKSLKIAVWKVEDVDLM